MKVTDYVANISVGCFATDMTYFVTYVWRLVVKYRNHKVLFLHFCLYIA